MLVPTHVTQPPAVQAVQLIGTCPISDAEIQTLAANAAAVSITDNPSLLLASSLISSMKRTQKSLTDWIAAPKKWLNDLKSAVIAEADTRTAILQPQVDRLSREKIAYERKVEEENRAQVAAVQDGMIAMEDVQLTALPTTAAASTRNLPWKAEVYDKRKFVEWCLADWENRFDLIEPQVVLLNAKAKSLQEKLEALVPGVRAVRGQTVVSK